MEPVKKAEKRLIIGAVVLALLAAGYWYFKPVLPLDGVVSLGNSLESGVVDKITQTFSAPPPLRVSEGSSTSVGTGTVALTRAGVIADTNLERSENAGLPALSESAALDEIASIRLADMFTRQYFAHVAPDGESAETVASSVRYSYLALGENLALGNFAGDDGVVAAWMNSPGHRANILDVHYREIGVAVRSGIFQGQRTWIAVQVFGRPASDCPSPNGNLQATINVAEAQLSQTAADLAAKKTVIDAMRPQYGDAYDQAATQYNTEIDQYNSLLAATKPEVTQYNTEVQAFNACIAE